MKNCNFHSIAEKIELESIRIAEKTMLVLPILYRKDKVKTQNYRKDDICHTSKNCLNTLQTYEKPLYLAPIYILRIYMGQKGFSTEFEQFLN